MTKSELLVLLQDVPDSTEIVVAVKSYTQVYPSCYVSLSDAMYSKVEMPSKFRLQIHLPEGFSIHQRKAR